MEVVYNKATMEQELNDMEVETVEEEVFEDAVEVTGNDEEVPSAQHPIDYRTYDFGDLTLECGRCGERHVLESGVEGGVQVILPTTDKHNLTMTCTKCGNFTKLYFTENFTKKKEVNDETSTTDKAEESVLDVSESN